MRKGQNKRKSIRLSSGRIYITSSFNNTIISITDERGNVAAWSTSGANGFKGTKKGTPFAAQITMSKVLEKAMSYGLKQAAVYVSGPGPGRETALRAIAQSGIRVVFIKDVTPIPHNGCRPPKPRRV
jgi:small subunit ribosomal protein S11